MNRRLLLAILLALVLPLAQAAAAAHEVTHLRSADKGAPAVVHCDLCMVASAVTGGGATSQPPVLEHAPAPQPVPAWQAAASLPAVRVAHFRSRAPPFLR